MSELMRKPAIVIPSERIRQSKKESLGVKYCVKKAESTEPRMPPIATRDHAYTCRSEDPFLMSFLDCATIKAFTTTLKKAEFRALIVNSIVT